MRHWRFVAPFAIINGGKPHKLMSRGACLTLLVILVSQGWWGRKSASSFKVRAGNFMVETSATGNERTLLSRALRMSYTRSWADCCLAEDRQQHSHISSRPPCIATDEFYADVHIPFNHKVFFSFLVKIWLIAMGTPKQQSFALPGSR